MVRQQEMIDSMYARRVAEKIEKDDVEKRRRAEIRDQFVAKKMQAYEMVKNNHAQHVDRNALINATPSSSPFVPDVNRVGLPIIEDAHYESAGARHHASVKIAHNLRNLRLNDCNGNHGPEMENVESCSSGSNYSANYNSNVVRVNRTPTPATLLPEDLNEILTDADLQEEANKRLQEEKDAEFAKMLQKQEEEIINDEIDRDRLMAIEAQDKELAKLLYEKEKAKLKRAKERARQRALLKKQSQNTPNADTANNAISAKPICPVPEIQYESEQPSCSSSTEPIPCTSLHENAESHQLQHQSSVEERPQFRSLNAASRTPPVLQNVAMHIDPTYLSQQLSSMPNSLIFQEGDNTAPPYMPIQGQRRNPPLPVEKKQKKAKPKDGCKQQ
ncbi:uncharacterized protein LOC135844986 isoform X2 [Planococcus citri]